MLQALNVLENADLKSMGYNSPRYIHTVYQAMSHGVRRPRLLLRRPGLPARGAGGGAPLEGVREAALRRDARASGTIPTSGPATPIPSREAQNPFKTLLDAWHTVPGREDRPPGARPPRRLGARRRGRPGGDDVRDRGGRRGLGGLDDAERRLEPGGHRRAHRHRPQPAHAGFRARRAGEPLQRARARQAAAGDAHPDALDEGRPAAPGLRRPGRRHAGPEPAAVLPERRRVRHERPAGGGGPEREQPPAAQHLRLPTSRGPGT